ncbi:MAG: O-antigen ligase family protein [Bacteroidales bacterium]|nr:O-antigen ligase family protein [Bacteroidales bacterium]
MKKVISNIDFEFIFHSIFPLLFFSYVLMLEGNIANYYSVNLINLLWVSGFSVFIFWNLKEQVYKEIDFFIILFLFFTIISSIFSKNFWQSSNELYIWGFYYLTYVTLVQLAHQGWSKEHLINILILVGSTFIIFKWILAILWMIIWNDLTNIMSQSVLVNSVSSRNQTSVFAYSIFSLSLSFFIRSKWNNVFYLLSLLSSAFMVIISTSRGGLIGLSFSLILVISGHILRKTNINLKSIKKYWRKAVWGGGGFLLLIGLVAWRILSVKRSGMGIRFRFWSSAAEEFFKNPIFGSGLYTMGNNLLNNLTIQPLETQLHTHAHSIYFNVLGELGIIGIISFLLLLFITIKSLWINFSQDNSYLHLGAMGALGGFLAHGLVDTLYVEPRITFLITIILGIAISSSKNRIQIVNKYIPIFSGVVITVILISGWLLFGQRHIYENALSKGNSNNWVQAYDEFNKLIKYKPKYALAYQQKGMAASEISLIPGNDNSFWISKSIQDFENAIRYDPSWPVNYANLGVLYASQQKYDKALDYMEKAYSLAPQSALINLNYAVIAEEAGETELARRYYWKVIDYKVNWIGGPFWEETDLRRLIFNQYTNMRWVYKGPELYEAQYLGLIEKGKHSRGIHLGLAKIYLNEGDIKAAERETEIADMLSRKFDEGHLNLLWYKAKIEFMNGNEERAFQLANQAFQGWEKQSIRGPGTYASIRYGENYFRRPDFKNDLVPQFTIAPMPTLWINREIKVAKWYLKFDKVELAEKLLEKVLCQDPNNKEAEKLITQINN